MGKIVINYCDSISVLDAITACIMCLYRYGRQEYRNIDLGTSGKVCVTSYSVDNDKVFKVYKDLEVA